LYKTRTFFGKSNQVVREYEEWFNTLKFSFIDVQIALRPYIDGGSESLIVVVYKEQ
jgi:hypothetical protein